MEVFSQILSLVLFFPFVGWGIYTLRLRYRHEVELSPLLEAVTLTCLVIFYAFELTLLKAGVRPFSAYFVFALLGLFISGVALYGPMVVSLASQVLVNQVMPAERSKAHEPNYAVAEALERDGDYEGAVLEYKVIARMFPRDPVAMIRIANNLIKQAEAELAAPWFECAIKCLDSPEKNLSVTNRLVELYDRQLGRPDEATRVLETYLARFPDTAYRDSIRRRLERLTKT